MGHGEAESTENTAALLHRSPYGNRRRCRYDLLDSWMYSFSPAQVRITEKAIIRSTGQTARTIKPHLVSSFRFEEHHNYTVLRLVITKQPDLVCALPRDKSPADIERMLAELRIQKK